MKRCTTNARRYTTAVLSTVVLAASGSVFAQNVDDVLEASDQRLELARQSQERVNNVVEGTRSAEDQYRAINKEIDGLRVYNRLMVAQTNGQEAVLDDISLSLEQVDMINRQIFPLMERMIDGLEQSIELDVPFMMSFSVTTRSRRSSIMNGTSSSMDCSSPSIIRSISGKI